MLKKEFFLVSGLLSLLLIQTTSLYTQETSGQVILNESFENVSVGGVPDKWPPVVSGGAKIGVVEKENKWGKRCLMFQNAIDAERSFEPDLEIVVEMRRVIRLSFDVLSEDGKGVLNVVPRKDPQKGNPGITGPFLKIENGKVTTICDNKWMDCGELPAGKWVHVEIVMRMKTEGNPSWDLILTLNGESKSYTNFAYTNEGQIPDMLTRLVFHGSNKNTSATYLDNLLLEVTGSQETAPSVKEKAEYQNQGETTKKDTNNLCLKIEGTTVEADSYIGPHREGAKDGLPENIIDGKQETYWLSGRRKTSVVVTFPEPVSLSQSFWFNANILSGVLAERGLKDYNIKTSLDGEKWENAVSVRDYKGGKKHDTFPARKGRYVKLEILQVQGFLLPVLCEWELYEKPRPIPDDELSWNAGVTPIPVPQPSILVAEVASDKIMYRPGENARLIVKLDNQRTGDGNFNVVLYLGRGVQEPKKLTEWNAEVKSGASRSLEYTIKNLREEYGYYALAKISENNQEILRSDCVFEVADNWAKISRHYTDVGFEKLVPDLPEDEITGVHIPIWRKLYINTVHFFSQNVYFSQHYTDKEEWDFLYPGTLNNLKSARTIQMWTKAGKENGIHILCYTEPGSLSPELKFDTLHPDWIIYGPLTYPETTKHLYCLPHWYQSPDASFPKGKPIVGPDLHMYDVGDMCAMTDYLADDWAKAVQRFGWEGSFFDSFPWQLECSAWGHNKDGKPLNTLLPDEIGARLLSRIKAEILKVTGQKFITIANFAPSDGVSPWHDENINFEDFQKNKAVYRKTLSELGIVFLEQHPFPLLLQEKDLSGKFLYPQTIEDTVHALRLIREANDVNVPVMLMPLQYTRRLNNTVVDAHLLYSSSYASGVLLSLGSGTPPRQILTTLLSASPIYEVEANYNKFAARYGEYLFDLNIRWLPQEQVMCSAPANVWWKDLVSYRKYNDGRMDIYIHLINRPDVPLTWGKKMNPPVPLNNIEVSIKDQKGKKLTGVWCISPNGKHNPLSLETQHENGKITVTVSRLEYWTMLVCRFEPK
ncbi:MAG: glycoside hydrolase family 66 protein [Candidatus Omnitrophota bacterium]